MGRLSRALFGVMIGGAGLLAASSASASLTVFTQFTGSYGLSTDGGGSSSSSYGVSAFVPVGATVTAAYLYQANYAFSSSSAGNQPITFNGTTVTFGAESVNNASSGLTLSSSRANVTALVAPIINGGAGGTYNFTIGEGNTNTTDGTALVVVYSLASLPTQTVAILDGFSAVGGDQTTLNFAQPIDPTAAGFVADLRLGISFSAAGQSSNVSVNGTQITSNAGNYDDGQGANGALITVGGNDDPFSPLSPSYADDHERYNIAPYIAKGSSSIMVNTNNPSGDDNIFLATFLVSGTAAVNAPVTSAVPEAGTWAMMMVGLGAAGATLRRRKDRKQLSFAA